jgi:hypothetical protein
MGVDGVGLFQDDVAMDVCAAFDDALERGLTPGQAADSVLADPPWPLDDTDDGPVTWLALAALLLREGALRDDVRDQAQQVIASGAALARWEEAPNAMRMARERVLQRFGALLAAGAATPEELQAVTEPQFRGWRR